MDKIDYKICKTQGKIFGYAAKHGYVSKVFSDEYLRSDFCERAFDTIYSRFQFEFPSECMDFILPEIGSRLVMTTEKQDIDLAETVGRLYRCLYFASGKPSRELADLVPFDVMVQYVNLSFMEGEDVAIAQLCEDLNIAVKDDKICF